MSTRRAPELIGRVSGRDGVFVLVTAVCHSVVVIDFRQYFGYVLHLYFSVFYILCLEVLAMTSAPIPTNTYVFSHSVVANSLRPCGL